MASKRDMTAERILDAAFKAIAAKGCGAVTLRGIAETAGVALSQLNYYYVNKDGLFAAVLRLMKQDYAAGLEQRLASCAGLAERMTALIDYNETILRERPDMYRNFLEFFNFAMNAPAFRLEVLTFLTDISAMIETSITADGITDIAPPAVTRFILSASFGISIQHLLDAGNQDVLAGFALIKAAAAALLNRAD